MSLYVRNEEIAKYIYPEICDKAIDVGKRLRLNNEQLNVYNFICRKDFYLTNYSGDNFFNPASEYGTNTTWMNNLMKKLVKNGLVKVHKSSSTKDRRFKLNYFYDSDTQLKYLIDGGCPVANMIMRKVKDALDLPDGWLSDGPCEKNGIKFEEDSLGFKVFSYNGFSAEGDFSIETALNNLYFEMSKRKVPFIKPQ